MSQSILSCVGVSKTFKRAVIPSALLQDALLRPKMHSTMWQKQVLRAVDVHVQQGEWVGLYGPNGAGKTTLLRILAGILPPDTGTVECSGRISGFFGLGAGFHQERSAVENIYLHALLHGATQKDAKACIPDVLSLAGIEGTEHLPIKCLSTGMGMRLAFSAAIHIESDIYLFDEVLAVGDAEFQQTCREQFEQLRERGKTVVMVLHNEEQLRTWCDRILYMEDGMLKEGVSTAGSSPKTLPYTVASGASAAEALR